jgi:hypothetical protein
MAVVHAALCDTEQEFRAEVARLRGRPGVRLLEGGLMPGGHKWWQKYEESAGAEPTGQPA